MLPLLTIVILATFAGLLVREDIAATPVDWIARRVPPRVSLPCLHRGRGAFASSGAT